jgi:capsular exopolysaccharide synthesis family protein
MANKPSLKRYMIEEEDVVNYREIIRKIINKWYLFGIFGVLGLSGAYVANKIIQPRYDIQATLYAPDDNRGSNMANIFNTVGFGTQTKIQNHIGILSSYSLTRQALENLNWRLTWFEDIIFSHKDLYKYSPFKIESFNPLLNLPGVLVNITPIDNNNCLISVNKELRIGGVEKTIEFEYKYTYGDTLQNEYFNFVLNKVPGRSIDLEKRYGFVFNDLNNLANSYLKRLNIALTNEEAEIINLNIEGNQVEREVDFVNELCAVFVNYGLREKNRTSENTVQFIDSQLTGLVDSLQSAGRSFTNFRSQNRIVDLSQEATLIVERLEILQSEESMAKMRLEYYQNLGSYLGDADKMEQVIAPSVVGITDPALNSMVVSLSELYSRRSTLSFTVQEKNPSLLALENEIQYMRSSLEENLKNLISNTQIQLQSLQENLGQLNYQLAQLPKKEQDLVNIKRQFDLNNELYTFLLQKKAEAAITKASNVPDVQIIDRARIETAVILGPNKIINFIIGLFLGLGIPMLIVILIHYFDQTIKGKEDIEKETHVPVINEIGHYRKNDLLPVINYPHSGIAESFRILRTNLEYFASDVNQKVIALHSTVPGEGKTFFAVNLASIIAQNNKKVLLICGDLRKPKIHNIFNVANVKGLSTFLIDKDNIDDIIVNSKIKNLTIIPSGPTPPNPAELLGNKNLEKLINKAKEYFDYIVIDNAPVGIVADAIIIGELADINLFVARSEYTRKEQINVIDHYNSRGIIKNMSIVVNDVKNNNIGYSKYNGKGYGFYAESNPAKSKKANVANV